MSAGAVQGGRFASISAGIRQVLTEHASGVVCIDAIFFNKNVSSRISDI